MTTWRERAACLGADPYLFFAEGRHAHVDDAEAKAFCATCPVRNECLADALENREDYGIFGGLTADERKPLLPPYERPRAGCGTPGGYQWHMKRHERSCEPCRTSYNAARAADSRARVAS